MKWSALSVVVGVLVVLVVGGVVGRLAGGATVTVLKDAIQPSPPKRDLVAELKSFAQIKQQDLPFRIDGGTVLKNVTASGYTITFSYEVSTYEIDFGTLRSNLTNRACRDKFLRETLNLGVLYIYSYANAGKELGEITVTSASC